MKYESFSCGLDEIESFDMGFCLEYESFSFDPNITSHLFEPSKSQFLEYETFVPMTIDFDKTLEHAKIKSLVDSGPFDLPKYLVMMI